MPRNGTECTYIYPDGRKCGCLEKNGSGYCTHHPGGIPMKTHYGVVYKPRKQAKAQRKAGKTYTVIPPGEDDGPVECLYSKGNWESLDLSEEMGILRHNIKWLQEHFGNQVVYYSRCINESIETLRHCIMTKMAVDEQQKNVIGHDQLMVFVEKIIEAINLNEPSLDIKSKIMEHLYATVFAKRPSALGSGLSGRKGDPSSEVPE